MNASERATSARDNTKKKSLATLDKAGVAGAKEALLKNGSVHECAVILRAVNPPGKSPAFDRLVRLVHQTHLLRTGDIELLLLALGDAETGVASRAKRIHALTLRSTVLRDKAAVHKVTLALAALTLVSGAAFWLSGVLLALPPERSLKGMAADSSLRAVKYVSGRVFCVAASAGVASASLSALRLLYVAGRWVHPALAVKRECFELLAVIVFAAVAILTNFTGVAYPVLFVAAAAMYAGAKATRARPTGPPARRTRPPAA